MNPYLIIILATIIGEYTIQSIARLLNLRALDPQLPNEFTDVYDGTAYAKSQSYTRTNSRFSMISSTVSLITIILFILFGGFDWVDQSVRQLGLAPLQTGLLFFAALFVLSDLLNLPFSLYATFVIEKRFGFNKTSPATYLTDKLKAYLIAAILGSLVLGGILYFFESAGSNAWFYAWMIVALFMLVMPPLFTSVIAPLFNKFSPLEDGELKQALDAYAKKVDFQLSGVFVMDGSKRSSKSNAYFSGFGKRKRVVLFDTLIEQQSEPELVAILAHEIGHYKKKHIQQSMAFGIVHTGILFYLMGLFVQNAQLFEAFGMQEISTYAGLTFFGLLYSPVSFALGVFQNAWSRKNEFEADAFSASTTLDPESLIAGLKKLSVKNLGNLTPHPFSVFLNHGHPPVMKRIEALRSSS